MPLQHQVNAGTKEKPRYMWTYVDPKDKVRKITNFNQQYYDNAKNKDKRDKPVTGYVVMKRGDVAFVDKENHVYYPSQMPADKKKGQHDYYVHYQKTKGITVRPPRQATPAAGAKGGNSQGNRFAALDKIRFEGDWFKTAKTHVRNYFIERNKTASPFSGENIPASVQKDMPKQAVSWFYAEKAKRSGKAAPAASKPQANNSPFHLELTTAEKEKASKNAAKIKLHATLKDYVKAVGTGINKAEFFDSGGKLDMNKLKEEIEEFVRDFQGSSGIFEGRPADMRMNKNLSEFYQIIGTAFTGSATEKNANAKKAFSSFMHGEAAAYADVKNQEVSKTMFVDGLKKAFEILERGVGSMSNYYERQKLMAVKEKNLNKKVAQAFNVSPEEVHATVADLVNSTEPIPKNQSQFVHCAIITQLYHELPEEINGKPKSSYDSTRILVEILKHHPVEKFEEVLSRWINVSPLFFDTIKDIKSSNRWSMV